MTAITHARPAGTAGSGLARYREALRTPGALAFAIPGVVGRMPMAMLSLAQVILLTAVTGSYGIAGLVSAAGALLYAAVTPRAARLADRYGQARVLRPQVIVFATATAALAACAISRAPVWILALTAALSRATMPSLGPMVRSRWTRRLGAGRGRAGHRRAQPGRRAGPDRAAADRAASRAGNPHPGCRAAQPRAA